MSSTLINRLLAPSIAATSSLSFRWIARESLFWARWIRNTIRNVIIVVNVLITNCHVSNDWNSGRLAAQITISNTARKNAVVVPDQSVTLRAIRAKNDPRRLELSG